MGNEKLGKKIDRRTAYTKSVIKETFFELLHEKGFEKTTVTDICRRSEINRGTFYLHYEDKYELLYELIDEALDSESPLDGSTPTSMCQRVPSSEDHRMLYTDPSLFVYVSQRVIERGRKEAVPAIMKQTGLAEGDASTLFLFTANGNLAVNRMLGWKGTREFAQTQQLVQRFIEGGYSAVANAQPDRPIV